MLRALRNVFAMQSVTPEAVSNIMSKVCHLHSAFSPSTLTGRVHPPQAIEPLAVLRIHRKRLCVSSQPAGYCCNLQATLNGTLHLEISCTCAQVMHWEVTIPKTLHDGCSPKAPDHWKLQVPLPTSGITAFDT